MENKNSKVNHEQKDLEQLAEELKERENLTYQIEGFRPHFKDWQRVESSIGDSFDMLGAFSRKDYYDDLEKVFIFYVDPKTEHSIVTVGTDDDGHIVVSYVHKTQYVDDPPFFHRLLGPAQYTLRYGHMTDIKWLLFDEEYSEYEYWKRVCELFADRIKLCLSMDETRLFLDQQYPLPFPERLNLPVTDISRCEDMIRHRLDGHPVWKLRDDEYVRSEEFWRYWEMTGFDLKLLF